MIFKFVGVRAVGDVGLLFKFQRNKLVQRTVNIKIVALAPEVILEYVINTNVILRYFEPWMLQSSRDTYFGQVQEYLRMWYVVSHIAIAIPLELS